jgi:3-hydroxyacyl-CoA dehydrogenase
VWQKANHGSCCPVTLQQPAPEITVNSDAKESTCQRLAIIGAGSIGCNLALVFSSAGHMVRLCEVDAERRKRALDRIAISVGDLREFGLCTTEPEEILSRIAVTSDLGQAVSDAAHVQECVPEELQLKRKLFRELEMLAPDSAVLASSSSAIPASNFAVGLETAARCLVAHPGNPPTLIRAVEVVPAPFTSAKIVDRACMTLRSAGMTPVALTKEVTGFAFNRLQGAVLREAYCLVRDGVASVEDIDTIVRDGLGLRWAVIGPFETADLNRRGGIAAHAEIMGPAYEAMGAERGQHDPWTADLVAEVEAQCRERLPLEKWDERVRWRDRQIMKLLASRRT